jgi:hypothetical protein
LFTVAFWVVDEFIPVSFGGVEFNIIIVSGAKVKTVSSVER